MVHHTDTSFHETQKIKITYEVYPKVC